jgi:hypothetical protein
MDIHEVTSVRTTTTTTTTTTDTTTKQRKAGVYAQQQSL